LSKFVEIPGSGKIRVTSPADVKRVVRQTETAGEDVFQTLVEDFWAGLTGMAFSPRLIERVWVAARCIQLNAQQISRMPLRFFGTSEPAWVANPDPVWYPNGIGDAIFSAIDSMYRWGDAFIYITSRYSSGFPSAWTVLKAPMVSVESVEGRRRYRYGQVPLNSDDMVQVSRDPRGELKGTSALASYSAQMHGLLAASELGRIMMGEGGTPHAVIKSKRKVNEAQALKIQQKWVERTAVRRGAPAVIGPDLDFEQLSFSPADLLLLDAQQVDARIIASAMGVPALFVNLPIEGGLNYQSPSMLGEHWWRFELRPMGSTLTQALSAQMLPRGSYVEFDARDTLAPTFADLVSAWVQLVDAGIVTIEELRAAVLRLPPLEQQEALKALTTPPSAGASPADQPANLLELRPSSGSTY